MLVEHIVTPIWRLYSAGLCKFMGSREGAVVRAIASHQCGSGSNPGWLIVNLLLVLHLLQRIVSGFSWTLLNTFNFQFDLETVDEKPFHGMGSSKFISLSFFICLFAFLLIYLVIYYSESLR